MGLREDISEKLTEYKGPLALGAGAVLTHFGLYSTGLDEAGDGFARFIPYLMFGGATGEANVKRAQNNHEQELTNTEKFSHFFKGAAVGAGVWKFWEYFGANILPEIIPEGLEQAKAATGGYVGQEEFPGSSPYEAVGDWVITTSVSTIGKMGFEYTKQALEKIDPRNEE